jgi:peptide/nickel transport system substrate-binding protein
MTPTRRALLLAGGALPFLRVPARAQASAGILRFGLSAFPPNLQPWVSTGASAGTVKMLTHRSLVSYDSKGELRGELAESWAMDDDGAWVFKLRPGCQVPEWRAGHAEDVKWSIEQIAGEKSTAYMRTQFQGIERIEIADPHTVRLITKEPQATLPTWFANYNTFIIWRKSTANKPIGAGPFRRRGAGARHLDRARRLRQVLQAGFPKLKGIKLTSMPTRTSATPPCSPAMST